MERKNIFNSGRTRWIQIKKKKPYKSEICLKESIVKKKTTKKIQTNRNQHKVGSSNPSPLKILENSPPVQNLRSAWVNLWYSNGAGYSEASLIDICCKINGLLSLIVTESNNKAPNTEENKLASHLREWRQHRRNWAFHA